MRLHLSFRAFAFVVCTAPLAACATATDPDVVGGGTDAGVHDSAVVFDSSGGDTTTTTDTNVDVPCLAPKKVCSGKCVDPNSDNANCGACGKTCGDGSACSGGTCTVVGCTDPKVTCPDGSCVDLLSDPDHCGTCDNKCGLDGSGAPKICKDATCQLDCSAPGKTSCPGATTCVDLNTDDANCGKCGTACATGQKCASGTCITCPSPGTICGTKCVDTTTDGSNCGSCGKVCPTGESCSASACVCATGLSDCSGVCKDLMDDGSNCGTCGHVCATGTFCNAGTCSATCPTGKSGCGGSCIDTTSDPLNCGGCGKTCGATAPYCSGGACVSLPKCNASTGLKVLQYGELGAAEVPYMPTGAIVTTSTTATWTAMKTSDFAAYQLIVMGDGGYGGATKWDDANGNKTTWGAAITGRVLINTMDPTVHSSDPGAVTFVKNGLLWAATGPGTGLYIGPDYGLRKLDFLSTFGSWAEMGQEDSSGYAGDPVHILLTTHPTMTGETDTSMSSWGYTYHAGITSMPAGFVVVAQGTAPSTATVVGAKDVSCAP